MRSIAPFLRICNQQIVAGRRPWYSLNLSYRPYGRYLVMVLRDPLTMLVAISFTAYRDDRLAKKELWVTAILLHKKALVVPVRHNQCWCFWTPLCVISTVWEISLYRVYKRFFDNTCLPHPTRHKLCLCFTWQLLQVLSNWTFVALLCRNDSCMGVSKFW